MKYVEAYDEKGMYVCTLSAYPGLADRVYADYRARYPGLAPVTQKGYDTAATDGLYWLLQKDRQVIFLIGRDWGESGYLDMWQPIA